MNQILVATLIATSIIISGAYAASLVTDTSTASTVSSEIDNKKKSEIISAEYDGTNIIVENTGRENSEIVMFRFYDESGNEINRILVDDDTGRNFGISNPVIHSDKINSVDGVLKKHAPKLFTLSQLGIQSMSTVSGEIVTTYGNIIKIKNLQTSNGDGQSDGSGNDPNDPINVASSMIDGMGLQSRIIQKENDGRITHGVGDEGQDDSIRPYLMVSSSTDFAATVLEQDTELTYFIPEFWHKYDYVGNILADVTVEPPNILGYSQTRTLSGTTAASNYNDIQASGSGKMIMKLDDYAGQNIILRGDAAGGTFKIITSQLDLMTAPFTAGLGYLTHTGGNPGTNGISVVAGIDSTHTGKFDYSYWVSSSWHQHPCKCGVHVHQGYTANVIDATSTLVKTDGGDHTRITGHTNTESISSFRLFDTLPSIEKIKFSGMFEQSFTFPSGQTYLYAENIGTTMTIKGESNNNNTPFLEINNLPINTPYQITKDGLTIVTGMTSASGTILIDSVTNSPDTVGGFLKLYPDSLTYRGSFSTVVFDNLHMETIHIPTVEDKIYVVHAYANIPVTGAITLTNTNLDGTLPIQYLDANYVSGDAIKVPVIPGFTTINLTINGVPTSLNYADILGGTGIKIATPKSSTNIHADFGSRILAIEASAGTPTFVVATSDGTINAIMSETISGTVTITNTYNLQAIPPIPPAPGPRDPLEGFVEIYVNGVLIKTQTLGINQYPAFTSTNTLVGTTAVQSVTYKYPDYTLTGSTSVSVKTGDFVEFYLYGKINGEIESYFAPAGFTILSESGTASATVNIRDAHIQTSM